MDTNNTTTEDDFDNVENTISLIFVFIVCGVVCCCCCLDYFRELNIIFAFSCHKKSKILIIEPIEDPKFKTINMWISKECPICYDKKKKLIKHKCGHCFCEVCNTAWSENNNTCPLCRQEF